MVTQNCDLKSLPSVLGHENRGFLEICSANLKIVAHIFGRIETH